VVSELGFDIISGAIGSAIGAFLGFVGALFLDNRKDKLAKKNRDKIVINNIKDEISDIASILNQYIENNIPLNYSIQTPNWDAALYSGALLEFISNPIYSHTISVYSCIGHFNDMRFSLSKEDNINSIKAILEASHYIIDQ